MIERTSKEEKTDKKTEIRTSSKDAELTSKKIHIIDKQNPRRPGSELYKTFASYKEGMKVSDFLQAGGNFKILKRDVKYKHISVK